MKDASDVFIALVTAPDAETARTLARAALEARLVACANLVPSIESHYWWQGKIESAGEVLVIFKTTTHKLADLEKLILEKHPYDTAEFITLPVTSGAEKYLSWIRQSAT